MGRLQKPEHLTFDNEDSEFHVFNVGSSSSGETNAPTQMDFEDDDDIVFKQTDGHDYVNSSIESIDITLSDISIDSEEGDDVPLNFSIETSSDEDETDNIVPAKKTRKRYVWVEDEIFKTGREAHAALIAQGYTPHDTKTVADGEKQFFRCKWVTARSKEQCSSKRCIYQKNSDSLSRILRTTNAHDHDEINSKSGKHKMSDEMTSEIISCLKKSMGPAATYKLNWMGYPYFVCGTVDRAKKFHPLFFACCTNEKTGDFEFIFNAISDAVLRFAGVEFAPKKMIADAADAIRNAFYKAYTSAELDIMCYPHVLRNVRKFKYNNAINKRNILRDIHIIHLAATNENFEHVTNLFLRKWKKNEPEFCVYFKKEWLGGRLLIIKMKTKLFIAFLLTDFVENLLEMQSKQLKRQGIKHLINLLRVMGVFGPLNL